ncbi:MAG: AAA family ATPase [Faecalibacterium sp.]|nr:AAA family ATPase [Ruminococcus sp.]MCM1392576.1 AAA family ATPase [Ruminococcus sp.]MCM1485778.1 AAA family ATPase [Faecalibacterium sp.]
MAEIKHSEYLDYVLLTAMGIYNTEKSKTNSAEKFIMSLINIMDLKDFGPSADGPTLEYTLICEKFANLGINVQTMFSKLSESINDDNFLSGIYFQMRMSDAAKKASDAGEDELTVPFLLDIILNNPSKAISDALEAAKETTESNDKASNPILDAIAKSKGTDSEKSPEAKNTKPIKEQLTDLTEKTKEINRFLSETVFGQDKAINVFTTGYFQSELLSIIDKGRTRPSATFLFAGPPGVGKTFLAEKAAEALKLPFKRFDMSEYCDKEASIEFIGSDNVYKNSKGGNFTTFVAENPRSIILFDEIEKAHISIIHLFLQILDAGRIRDSNTDKEISLSNTIMIFTTNAGKQLYENSDSGDFSSVSRKVILKALQSDINPTTDTPYFPAAICSRFASGNVVMFNHIQAHNLHKIAKKEILRHSSNFEKQSNITISIGEDVFAALLFAEGGQADARTIRSRAETFFNDELFELFRLINSSKVTSKIDDLHSIQINIELPENKEIQNLFKKTSKQKVLLFTDDTTASLCAVKCPTLDFEKSSAVDNAVDLMNKSEIDFILIDLTVGIRNNANYLNAEDIDSDARDFLHIILEKYAGTPVYLLQSENKELNIEEKTSFLKQGIRGFVSMSNDTFSSSLVEISESIHQQKSIESLAKANKVVTFETSQVLSDDGTNAVITLFDLKISTAIDSEDAENILSNISKPNVHFDQVIGSEDAKSELQYFIQYLKNPKSFLSKGVSAPKGVILYGPPGTGKTMLAKAMACESDVTFITAEGNQFLKRYVGEGPEKVHELFRTARKYAPSILFIDEIDAIAKERKGGENSTVAEEILTAFLAEMDGFKNDISKPVFVLAATNFDVEPGSRKSLDPALMRRFDRRIFVDLPLKDERLKYIKMKISSNSSFCLSDEKIENIVTRSTGMSIAQLESVFELALRTVIRSGNTKVTDEVFDEAFETFNSGEKKNWDDSQLERVARHESGHALLCWLSGETPSYLTITARGDHGGYMQHADNEGKAIYTKDELLSRIRTALGGRAAEIVCYGPNDGISTGPSGDLNSATAIARQIICSYGMDSQFGLAVISPEELQNGEIALEVRKAVNEILSEEMQNAISSIESNRECFDTLVDALLQKNHITGEEIDKLLTPLKK